MTMDSRTEVSGKLWFQCHHQTRPRVSPLPLCSTFGVIKEMRDCLISVSCLYRAEQAETVQNGCYANNLLMLITIRFDISRELTPPSWVRWGSPT